MDPETKPTKKIKLSASQIQQMFKKDIVPDIGVVGAPVDNPTFSVVSAQPGAGKSTAIRQTKDRFQGQPTQVIIPDDLCRYIPGYNDARKAGVEEPLDKSSGSPITEWYNSLLSRAFRQRANIILESCYTPENYRSWLKYAKESGYRLELNVLATNRRVSFTGIHDRFDKALESGAVDGTVLPDLETHDYYYALMPRLVFHVEKDKLFDSIRIARRGNAPRYENELITDNDGVPRWKDEPRALRHLMVERNRPLSADGRDSLRQTWERLIDSPRLKTHPESKDLPLADYRDDLLNYLGNTGTLFPPAANKPEADRTYLSKKYVQMYREDRDLVLQNRSSQREFVDPNFEYFFKKALEGFDEWFSAEIKRTRNIKQETEAASGNPNHAYRRTQAIDELVSAGQMRRPKRVNESENDQNVRPERPTKRMRQSHIGKPELTTRNDRIAAPGIVGRPDGERAKAGRRYPESISEKRMWAELDRADPGFEAAIRTHFEKQEQPQQHQESVPENCANNNRMVTEHTENDRQASSQDSAMRGLAQRSRNHGRDN